MDPSLHDLVARLDDLPDGFLALRDGVHKAVLVADLDPEMALTRLRKVLEYVIRDVFERRVKEPPGTRPLENLLQRLVKEGVFPDRLDAYANTVRKLGNLGTHSFGERITDGDVYQSLAQLMPILEWYFEVERPDSSVRLAAKRGREPEPDTPARVEPHVRPGIAVVPKGLRSFDAADSDFFLALLPGPRYHDGLPESLRFWKYRIEESREPSFAVGVIYGPSGCGKSSLVKAGLLPRLARDIVVIYVEATANETEARLLAGLRKRLPTLAADLDLVQTLTALRQGHGLLAGQKVLLVLDQFEQWLHARRLEQDSELAQALRQCDGEHVQCVVLVRDDFWLGLSRFMSDLHIEIVQGRNAALIDLFDPIHARSVLAEFGQAYGRLPEDRDCLTQEAEAFLAQSIEGLAQDGRVISVRLALFAEMIKGKPWTPATLAEAGGMERIGVTFLEETFRAPTLKVNEKPAQAVLKALLPERGGDIMGHMRSYEELRAAAGDTLGAEAFAGLLTTLDREVRLITPTDPEGRGVPDREDQRPVAVNAPFYQLTHDYLVPSLREWLNRKQRETRRGRAALLLAERAALWRDRPENRFLPSAGEWCRIRLFTPPMDWTESQRRMMRRATRVYGVRTLSLLIVAATLLVSRHVIWQRVQEDRQKTLAAGLVNRLLDVDTPSVPAIIEAMNQHRPWVDPELRRRLPLLPAGSRRKLHASLALLPDKTQVEYLDGQLLRASPTELPVIWKLLREHHHAPIQRLWAVLEDPRADREQGFRAACALVDSEAIRETRRWDAVSRDIADRLLATILKDASDYSTLIATLRPVGPRLILPLSQTFRDAGKPETERSLASGILADYARDRPEVLADLLMDAAPPSFAILFPRVQAQASGAVAILRAELSKTANTDADQEKLYPRQARAAVALVQLGQADSAWPLLRHSPNPSVRSNIVHWLKRLQTDPKALIVKLKRLAHEPPPPLTDVGPARMDSILFHPVLSLRRALILALGEYKDLPAGDREPLAAMLLDAYRNDPDAGIHGAAEWALRQWNHDETLEQADAELQQCGDAGCRRWLVNSQRQTMAVIEGPIAFTMGSPATEPGRFEDEILLPRRIHRRFAVAAKEVTREQYGRFVQASPRNQEHAIGRAAACSPDPEGPQTGVSWYDAAAYCNWLSAQEKLEVCYEPNEQGEYAEGMKITADFRGRSGYRLPTETEWEYVCRAGTLTSRYYGGSLDLLEKYAWFLHNSSESRASRCGLLKPNELGLFDLLGNAHEWCQDQTRTYSLVEDIANDDTVVISLSLKSKESRLLRGGTFTYPGANVRAAIRTWSTPASRHTSNGFRTVRTFP
jgi:formylglycine-generating enzyme required for sulfatase activity